jgi:hypothetical protein
MKNKYILMFFILFISSLQSSLAFQITKVSGPVSYPWIEIYNDKSESVDITGYKVFDSGASTNGHAISTTNIGSSFLIPANSYFIIAKDESRQVLQNISCPVFHSSLGVKVGDSLLFKKSDDITSFDVASLDTLSSTSCGSGNTVNNSTSTNSTSTNATSTNSTTTNTVITNTVYVYVPSNNQNKYGDIQVLLPEERVVPAGADVEYVVKVLDSQKNILNGLDFNWSFGDGGEKFDSKTSYHYTYPGEYTLIASADGYMGGAQAKMKVTVVTPDIKIIKVGSGGKENYIDLQNNTDYDLFLSNFYLNIDNTFYKLPKNFVIDKKKTVHVSGEALGFKLPAIHISLNYPDKNLLLDYSIKQEVGTSSVVSSSYPINTSENLKKDIQVAQKFSSLTDVQQEKQISKKVLNRNPENINNDNLKSVSKVNDVSILRHLVLSSLDISKLEPKKVITTENRKEYSENVKKDKPVDTDLIKWLKNLIY